MLSRKNKKSSLKPQKKSTKKRVLVSKTEKRRQILPVQIESIGRTSSRSVEKHTKKNWDQWIKILEDNGARHWTHQEIVAWLKKKHKLIQWWQQIVTTGFEQYIGRRIEGQNQKGEYAITTTKTLPHSQKKVWDLLNSAEGQAIWLKPLSDFNFQVGRVYETEEGVFGEVRTMKKPERVRMTWQETDWEKKTVVNIAIVSRPKEKCILVFQHDGIKNGRLKMQLKERWLSVVKGLAELLNQH